MAANKQNKYYCFNLSFICRMNLRIYYGYSMNYVSYYIIWSRHVLMSVCSCSYTYSTFMQLRITFDHMSQLRKYPISMCTFISVYPSLARIKARVSAISNLMVLIIVYAASTPPSSSSAFMNYSLPMRCSCSLSSRYMSYMFLNLSCTLIYIQNILTRDFMLIPLPLLDISLRMNELVGVKRVKLLNTIISHLHIYDWMLAGLLQQNWLMITLTIRYASIDSPGLNYLLVTSPSKISTTIMRSISWSQLLRSACRICNEMDCRNYLAYRAWLCLDKQVLMQSTTSCLCLDAYRAVQVVMNWNITSGSLDFYWFMKCLRYNSE